MLYNEHGVRGQQLLNRYPEYTKASIYHHVKKPIGEMTVDKRKHNPGRPRKLSERDERAMIRQVAALRETEGNFSCKKLKLSAGMVHCGSDELIRRVLKRHGYTYRNWRKKGGIKKIRFAASIAMGKES